MATLPTPSWDAIEARVRYTISTGEVFHEYRINQSVLNQLTDTELEALLDAMDVGVLTYYTDPGQIQRWVDYSYSGGATVNSVIRAS